MSDTTVIRSLLVKLGYQQDEAALKKFSDGIDKASRAVFALATAVSASAFSVALGVEKFASNLERLYFSAQRTHSSATNLKAFGRAVEDFGGSADGALASVEGLARFFRNNYGAKDQLNGWLSQVGKVATDDQVENLQSIAALFAHNTRTGLGPQNASLAAMWGIDEKTMLAMQNGSFAADLERIRQALGSAGFDQASKDAHRFMVDLRALGDQLQQFGLKAEEALLQHFHVSLKSVTEYLREHGDELSNRIVHGIETILDWGGKAKVFFEWLYQELLALDTATDGWSTKLLGIAALLKIVGATEIIGGVLGLTGAIARLGAGLAGLTVGAAGVGLGSLASLAAVVGAGVGSGWALDKLLPNNPLARLGDWLGNKFYDVRHQKEGAIQLLGGFGFDQERAAGIVARLNQESALNPGAVGDDGEAYGIAQWHPDRQAAFRAFAGKDIHGSTLQEQMAFLVHELRGGGDERAALAGGLIRDTDNAADSAEYFTRYFERPANMEREVARAREAGINLSAQTHITIEGGSQSAVQIAQAVKDVQADAAAEMARNLQAGVQ